MCCRGDALNQDMPDDVLEATDAAVDAVGTITPTGGEPLLVPLAAAKAIRMARDKSAESVFLSTNGSVSPFDTGVISVIQEITAFGPQGLPVKTSNSISQDDFNHRRYAMDERFDLCTIQVSVDNYHDEEMGYYSEWGFFRNVRFQSGADNSILDRGNAELYGIGNKFSKARTLSYELDVRDGMLFVTLESELYVNVHGLCFCDCDLSYAQQDNPKELEPGCCLGHISKLRETITQILLTDHPEMFEDALTAVA
jgi:hypothetical protein